MYYSLNKDAAYATSKASPKESRENQQIRS
jgi:hypothetical protein